MGGKNKNWIVIIKRTGEVMALQHAARLTAIHHADEHFKPRYFGNVLVKNDATGETWERRAIYWFKHTPARKRKSKATNRKVA